MNRRLSLTTHLFLGGLILGAACLSCACANSGERENIERSSVSEPQYEWGSVTGQTLTLWGRDTDLDRTYLKRAFGRYEELTGNTIRIVPFTAEELNAAVEEAFEDGTDAPDLVLSFGGVNIDTFDPDNNFYDFSDAVWVDDLTDTSINQAIYHGKVIGLPHWEASISGTVYNKKIFRQLGIEPPQTQEEFMQVCDILLKNGVTPLYLPCASPTMLLYQFPLDILVQDSNVLQKLNGNTVGYADLPGMTAIVEWYRTMAKLGYLGDNYMYQDWNGMSRALESGGFAMMLCWDSWLYTDFEGDPSDFGLMPAFIGVPENGTFEGPNLALMLVNKNGPKVDAAVDLITFMADPYNYNVAFQGIYTAPVFKMQLDNLFTPQYVEASPWIEQNYHDSTAWLRIRGFSQSDAVCIIDYMQEREDGFAKQCLREMDLQRLGRIKHGDGR